MIVTARQLEDLHRKSGGNGQLLLPYRARLTPLAQDWVRAKRVTLGYGEIASDNGLVSGLAQQAGCACDGPSGAKPGDLRSPAKCECKHGSSSFVWWCDGPCGPAKAVLMNFEKEAGIKSLDVQPGANKIVSVIKKLATQVKAGEAAGGILMVESGASALVYANRCPSLRAIIGTCQDAVERGIQQVAANVLVIEYPHKTLQQMKNMLGRFVKAKRELSEDAKRNLQELASCA